MRGSLSIKALIISLVILCTTLVLEPVSGIMVSHAGAQTASQSTTLKVKRAGGLAVASLQNCIPVGDGKTFIISSLNKFMVYTVDTAGTVKTVGGYEVSDLKEIKPQLWGNPLTGKSTE